MTKEEILSKLDATFTSRRTSAQNKAYANLERARRNPSFTEIEKEIKRLTFETGKAQAFGSIELAQKTSRELLLAKVKHEQILQSMGLTQSDITPQYSCPKCNDTGRVNGKLCECFKAELYNLLLSASGSKTKLASFKDYNDNLITLPSQKEQLNKIKCLLTKWVNNYPNVDAHTFLLCGKTGVGKTFMTECVASAMIEKGYLVSFISSMGLNNNFLKFHTTFDNNKQSYYDMFLEPELLVIDDLGTEPILKNVTINYLCALLSDRFNSGKATIITTNLSLNDILNRYGDRIFSRIANKADSKMFVIDGEDLRLKKR